MFDQRTQLVLGGVGIDPVGAEVREIAYAGIDAGRNSARRAQSLGEHALRPGTAGAERISETQRRRRKNAGEKALIAGEVRFNLLGGETGVANVGVAVRANLVAVAEGQRDIRFAMTGLAVFIFTRQPAGDIIGAGRSVAAEDIAAARKRAARKIIEGEGNDAARGADRKWFCRI